MSIGPCCTRTDSEELHCMRLEAGCGQMQLRVFLQPVASLHATYIKDVGNSFCLPIISDVITYVNLWLKRHNLVPSQMWSVECNIMSPTYASCATSTCCTFSSHIMPLSVTFTLSEDSAAADALALCAHVSTEVFCVTGSPFSTAEYKHDRQCAFFAT